MHLTAAPRGSRLWNVCTRLHRHEKTESNKYRERNSKTCVETGQENNRERTTAVAAYAYARHEEYSYKTCPRFRWLCFDSRRQSFDPMSYFVPAVSPSRKIVDRPVVGGLINSAAIT